jgi:CheY-like chemotaxis protein
MVYLTPMEVPKEYQNLSVLIVDDVFNVRNMIRGMLKKMGFNEFMEAEDGYQAIELISNQVVDLILCDWNMPKMNGIDLLKMVRNNPAFQNLPFIMVTGEVSEHTVAEAAETEVDAYIVKPFSVGQLGSKITDILRARDEISDIDLHLEKGRSYAITKQFANAKQEYQAALKINPSSPRTMLEMGRLYENQGNDQQAKHYYLRAIKVEPKYLKGHEALAKLYQALGDNKNHLKYLKKAVAISPRNLERKMLLGESLIKNGDKDEAVKILGDVLKDAAEQFAHIAQRVGQTFLAIQAYDDAEKAFSQALHSDPHNLYLFNDLGIAFRKQGKFDEAVRNYTLALKIAPEDENILYNLARAYYEGGDKNNAITMLENAIEVKPDFKEAASLLKKIKANKK